MNDLSTNPPAPPGGPADSPRELTGIQHVPPSGLAAQLAARDSALIHAPHEGNSRLSLAIVGSGTGVWDRDIPSGRIHYSPSWKAILGYGPSELGSQITESYTRVHPDDLAYVQATIQAHFDARIPSYEVEHRLRCKDGSYKWVSSRGKVVNRDTDGKPLRMVGTTTDITALREMAERLRQSAALIANLTNEVPGLVFQYLRRPGGEAFFPYASAGIRDIYEIDPQDVATSARMLDRIIHPDDLAGYHASLEASAASMTPWHLEYRVVLPGRGVRWRQGDARPQRLEDGGTVWHGFITDVTERKRIETELRQLATIDFLTQLPNRRHFMAQAEAEHARLRQAGGAPAILLICDLDHFKSINDRWGHAVGDLALGHFADLLREELRDVDVAGRMGGEEFAVLLRAADAAQARDFARRLQRRADSTPLRISGRTLPMAISMGVTLMNADDAGVEAPFERADSALYRAKQNGRNRIEFL